MKDYYDPWYVRLPTAGRSRRSTASVRHHVESGHPLNSMVRRTPDEEWVVLGWVAEFADFASSHARTVSPGAHATAEPPRRGRGRVSARSTRCGSRRSASADWSTS